MPEIPFSLQPPRLDPVVMPWLQDRQVTLHMLRLDLMHPAVGGNKWFKLHRNLEAARAQGADTVLSFGGAWSNHLAALASAARLWGLRSVGVVRGELPEPLNPVLAHARSEGMVLQPVTRGQYRHKRDPDFIAGVRHQYGSCHVIPEGGSNEPGVEGCAAIADFLLPADLQDNALIVLACGTGATLAGLLRGLGRRQARCRVRGVAVLKGGEFLQGDVSRWLNARDNLPRWQLETAYHCGGYARISPELTDFMAQFRACNTIPLEPVYTGKLMFAVADWLARGEIPPGTRVTALHTGGNW